MLPLHVTQSLSSSAHKTAEIILRDQLDDAIISDCDFDIEAACDAGYSLSKVGEEMAEQACSFFWVCVEFHLGRKVRSDA